MNFNKYIFRAHMVGNIISLPKPLTKKQSETLEAYRERAKGYGKPLTEKQEQDWHSLEHKYNESKKYKLTDGIKKILSELVMYEMYGRKPQLKTKYFTKGLEVEKQSRDLLSEVLEALLTSDNERKTNAWVTGRRDIKHPEVIIDIKSSFQFKTFNQNLVEETSDVYLRQLDSYMDLWGYKNSLLAFVLIDTPIKLVEDEIRRLDWQDDVLNFEGDVREEKIEDVKKLVCEHIYTREALEQFCQQSATIQIEWFDDFKEIPKHHRVHLLAHNYDPIRIEQRNECIRLAREYMNTVKPINNISSPF